MRICFCQLDLSLLFCCCYIMLFTKRSFFLFLFCLIFYFLRIVFFKCTMLQNKLVYFWKKKKSLCLLGLTFLTPFSTNQSMLLSLHPVFSLSRSLPVLVAHLVPCVTSFILCFSPTPCFLMSSLVLQSQSSISLASEDPMGKSISLSKERLLPSPAMRLRSRKCVLLCRSLCCSCFSST